MKVILEEFKGLWSDCNLFGKIVFIPLLIVFILYGLFSYLCIKYIDD